MNSKTGRVGARIGVTPGGRARSMPQTGVVAGVTERLELGRIALALGGCIAALGILGVAELHWPGKLVGFNLDNEYNVPATFSAALDLGAAIGAEALRRRTGRNVLLGLVILFAFMTADEFGGLHEHLESLTGIDWMKLYAPVFVFAGVAWIFAMRAFRDSRFRLCMLGGAACWTIAQVFELLEWKGDVKQPHYNLMMVPEELLEMTGSALFMIGMLLALRAANRDAGRRADRAVL
jgi:hypothetical protein